jgi:Ca2+-binding RTX toxin-like protein
MTGVTVGGALAPFNFTGPTSAYNGFAQADFASFFGSGDAIGANTADYSGMGAVPDASLSPNATLALLAGVTDTTVPSDYQSFYDLAGGDTVTGSGDLDVFLQGGLSSGTSFSTGTGEDKIYAGGSDTITASSGSNTIIGGSSGPVVVNGSGGGNLYFVGGAGAVSVVGGTGNSTLFGGTGSASTFLAGGSGNSTLVGGSGTGASTLGGGHNEVEFARGSGLTTLIAGDGNSLMVGVTGTGPELFSTSPDPKGPTAANPQGTTALIGLNKAADTVIGGTGSSTVLGSGAGNDTYSFLAGHAGGTETIYGLTEGDKLVFGNYVGNAIQSEGVVNGSDVIKLTDNTTITLFGINHTLFPPSS